MSGYVYEHHVGDGKNALPASLNDEIIRAATANSALRDTVGCNNTSGTVVSCDLNCEGDTPIP